MILRSKENIELDIAFQVRESVPNATERYAQLYEEAHNGERIRGLSPYHDCDWLYCDSDFEDF